MTDKQLLRNLRDCEVFSVLSDSELEKVMASAVEKEYESGTVIFNEGDSANELLVLQEGRVALQMILPRKDGQMSRRVSVEILGRNDVLGWSAIVEPYVYTLTAVCLQKVKVLSISGIKLRGLLLENYIMGYEVLNRMIKVVASRLHDTRQILISERSLP